MPGWSWAAFVPLDHKIVLEESDPFPKDFLALLFVLSFYQDAVTADASAHIPALPFSLF